MACQLAVAFNPAASDSSSRRSRSGGSSARKERSNASASSAWAIWIILAKLLFTFAGNAYQGFVVVPPTQRFLAENLVMPGLFELRAVNQYVVGAQSQHPNGSEYRWLNDASIATLTPAL